MTIPDQPLRDFPDRVIRQTLLHPENLRGFLMQAVPDLAPGFDCTRARLVERLFPLEDWREREADLPLEIPFRRGDEELWALVVVLIEHQSDTDRLMPLRLCYSRCGRSCICLQCCPLSCTQDRPRGAVRASWWSCWGRRLHFTLLLRAGSR